MIIQYQNTLEEYVEAMESLAARKAKKRRANARLYTAGMVALYFAAIWFYESISHIDEYVVLFHLLVPIAFSVAIVVMVLCITSMIAGRLPRIKLRAALGLGFFVLAVVILFFLYENSRTINPQSPPFLWSWTLLLPHTTWVFFVVWIAVATIRGQRSKIKRTWDEQPTFHRAKTADISAEGVVVTDVVSRVEVHWNGFVGWEETKTLFVLFLSEHQALFPPKHAFASEEEREAMRALARFIPTNSAAFPIIQSDAAPSTTPPLPAQKNLSV
jgi:hypothetical protein